MKIRDYGDYSNPVHTGSVDYYDIKDYYYKTRGCRGECWRCKNDKYVECRNELICEVCNSHFISYGYFYIINELKKNCLLPKDFKKTCCYCTMIMNGVEKV